MRSEAKRLDARAGGGRAPPRARRKHGGPPPPPRAAPNLLKVIARERSRLARAERRVADFVVEHPETVITMTMVHLKDAVDVSDPTIVRFSRRFGCAGYPELKVRLAQCLSPEPSFEHEVIRPADPVAEVTRKTLANSFASLQRFARDLDPAAVEEAVDRVLAAREVFLFSLGMSETVAFDAEHKLFRVGIRCRRVEAQQRQTLLAPTLRAGELALFLSHSGETRALVEAAAAARASGAATVAVTAPGSHLARTCDVVVGVPRYEQSEIYTPLAARLNHFIVTNMMVSAIGVKQGRKVPDALPALDPWVTDKFID